MSEQSAGARETADVAFIRALAEILHAHDLDEIDVRRALSAEDVLEVRLRRRVAEPATAPHVPAVLPQALGAYAAPVPVPAMAPAAAAAGAPAHAGASASAGKASADPSASAYPPDPAEHPGVVTSPMVGTAYLAPEPGAEPFVTVGQEVRVGQTLLIIEAMKTMNPIPSPHSGIVRRILVADGTPVEYGAPLMIIE